MSPPARTSRAKYHWGIAFATRLKRFTDPVTKLRMKHTNRRVRIPKGLYPRRIEAKMTKKQVGGKWILVREMTMISKDGEISKFPGYHSSEEEEEPSEQPKPYDLYGFVDHPELQRNEFAPHRLPQREGNMNGWLIEDEDEPLGYEASDKEVESDLESTARSKPKCKKLKKTAKAIPDYTFRDCPNGGNGGNNGCTYKGFMACNPKEYDGKGGAIALTRWIEKMENVIANSGCAENQKVKYDASSFVNKALTWWNTHVQARGREAAIGMPWTDFKALLVEELCPSNEMEKLETEFWNHKIVGANHVGYTYRFHELAKLAPHLVTPESSRIKRARILTDEAVSCGTLTKGNEKIKGVEETSKQGGWGNDNKRVKVSKGFVAATPYRNRHTGRRREPDFERYVKTMRQVLRNMQKTKVHNLESPYGKFNLYAFKICYCNTASNSGSGTLPGKLLPTLRKIIRLSLPEVGLPSKVRKTVFLTSRWGQGTRMPTANTEATKDGFIPPCCSYSIIVINPESNVAPVVTSSS
ncbi:reverse transcriptase domain-containing protein [Tanacetum coccineum]